MTAILWLILLAPLGAALLILFFFLKSKHAAAWTALFGILLSFSGALNLFFETRTGSRALPFQVGYSWIRSGWLSVDFGFLVDPLSVLMLLVITGVGSTIFLYSIGYMKSDASASRYFATLSFFAFSMIGIVLADNFLLLFVFWELVAVSSYLLIGFWFEKPAAADAGQKAFLVNRVADFGLLIGILYIWSISGVGAERTLDFVKLAAFIPAALSQHLVMDGALFAAALLIFCGVAGKSAQFPLYIWLPDAMEGPTPVSALIHAATMVAAGVYLLARAFFLIELSPDALGIIATIGAATAFLAGVLALFQDDIKKILAYSTVSQLGFMVSALGLGSPTAGMFHLVTHAFFKALLFLGAGAMIHALHTQNIWRMGGLLRRMPVTALAFLVGTLALCGIWPLSGFFSKDAILELSYGKHPVIFWLGLFTAGLTAFYMTRLVWVAILGKTRPFGEQSALRHPEERSALRHPEERSDEGSGALDPSAPTAPQDDGRVRPQDDGRVRPQDDEHADHPVPGVHDAPLVMKAPLIVLAIFSAAAGFFGIPHYLDPHAGAHHPPPMLPLLATGAALLGITLGSLLYARPRTDDPLKRLPGFFYKFVIEKYYMDHLALGLARFFQNGVARVLAAFEGNVLIEGLVNGTARLSQNTASLVRRAQTGRVETYAVLFLGFLVALIGLALFGAL